MPESLKSVVWGVLAESLIIPYIFHSLVVFTIYKIRTFLTGAMPLSTNGNYLKKETSHTVQEFFT